MEAINDMKLPPNEVLNTITITCECCGKEFLMYPAEQKFYKSKGYALPKRCPECREQKRNDVTELICIDCGKPFTIDGYEKDYFEKHNFALPKRCKYCRGVKRLRNNQNTEAMVTNNEEAREPMQD